VHREGAVFAPKLLRQVARPPRLDDTRDGLPHQDDLAVDRASVGGEVHLVGRSQLAASRSAGLVRWLGGPDLRRRAAPFNL
jgi:hypothetical protein